MGLFQLQIIFKKKKLSTSRRIYTLNQTILKMVEIIMKRDSFKSGLFAALADLEVFGTVSVDPGALGTTRSHVCMWNKDNPAGRNYKVIRIGCEVRVLRVK